MKLKHLSRRPLVNSGYPPPSLLCLHGYGSNEADLYGLASHLDDRLHIICARAPHSLAPGAFAWYDLDFTDEGYGYSPEQAEASRSLLVEFIEEATCAYGLDAGQRYVAGFSQGGALTYALTMTAPHMLAGAAILSGRTVPEFAEVNSNELSYNMLSVLVTHGIYDPILPIECGRELQRVYSSLPVNLTYREYPMAHTINEDCLTDVTTWLSGQLDRSET